MKKHKFKNQKSQGKVILLFVLMALILNVVVTGFAGYIYNRDIKESYSRICSGVSQVVASSVVGNKIDDMLAGNATEDYILLKNQVINTAEQIPDIERIYIYDMQRDGMYLLVDTKYTQYSVGEKLNYPQNLEKYIDDFYNAKTPSVFETISDGQFIMTSLLPVFDVRGNCVCYVGCDIDMTEAYNNRTEFIRNLAIIVLLPTFLITIITAFYIKNRILSSINCLDDYIKLYYDKEEKEE